MSCRVASLDGEVAMVISYHVGALLLGSRGVVEELVLLLHGLCNQILPSSTHSSVVQGHIEVLLALETTM